MERRLVEAETRAETATVLAQRVGGAVWRPQRAGAANPAAQPGRRSAAQHA